MRYPGEIALRLLVNAVAASMWSDTTLRDVHLKMFFDNKKLHPFTFCENYPGYEACVSDYLSKKGK